MILVFIFLGLLIISTLIFIVLLMSNLHIKINNFKIKDFKLKDDYKIYIQLYFLNKIKIFSIVIDSNKIKNISLNERFMKLKDIQKPKLNDLFKALNKSNIKIVKFELKSEIGMQDACILAYIVTIICSMISIILPHFVENSKQVNYYIEPVYNKNIFNLFLESIISIKIVNIIYVIYILEKKGSNKNERTSNRRSYAYGYE